MLEILTEYAAGGYKEDAPYGNIAAHHILQDDLPEGPLVLVVDGGGELLGVHSASAAEAAAGVQLVDDPQARLTALLVEQQRLAAELADLQAFLLA